MPAMGFLPNAIKTIAPIMGIIRKPASPAMLEFTPTSISSGTISFSGAFITETFISAAASPVDSNRPTPNTTTRPRIKVGKPAMLEVKLESIHTIFSNVRRLVIVTSAPDAGLTTVAPLNMAEQMIIIRQIHTNNVTGSHILLPTRSTPFKNRVKPPCFCLSISLTSI